MGATCLTACVECQRHVRCGERVGPFCGVKIAFSLRVLEYRLNTRLDRGSVFLLGAGRPPPVAGQGGSFGGSGGGVGTSSGVATGGLTLSGRSGGVAGEGGASRL